MNICILDYGVGNLFSVQKAFRKFSDHVEIHEDCAGIASCDALVLPGVGSFKAGMDGLEVRGLIGAVQEHAAQNKPLLGICLGAQLLLSKGEEFGRCIGLDIIPGKVTRMPQLIAGCKTPHIGWNALSPPHSSWKGTILQNVPSGSEMYFVHSYILQPQDPEHVLANTQHGGCAFASAIRKGNVYGCQFHPEKSAKYGLEIISQFLRLATL